MILKRFLPLMGWSFLVFILLGPPLGGILFNLLFSPLYVVVSIFPVFIFGAYLVGLIPASIALLLFWLGCFLAVWLFDFKTIHKNLAAGIGFLCGLLSMTIVSFLRVTEPLLTHIEMMLFCGVVSALCSLISINFWKEFSGTVCSKKS